MDTSYLSDQLNGLLKRNYDVAHGYRKASELVDQPELVNFMETYAYQRNGFVQEIRTLVSGLGGDPEKDKDIPGNLHYTWMNLRAAYADNNNEALLEECIRGEKAAIHEYQQVLEDTNLPSNVRAILNDQMCRIAEALRRVEELEAQYD